MLTGKVHPFRRIRMGIEKILLVHSGGIQQFRISHGIEQIDESRGLIACCRCQGLADTVGLALLLPAVGSQYQSRCGLAKLEDGIAQIRDNQAGCPSSDSGTEADR